MYEITCFPVKVFGSYRALNCYSYVQFAFLEMVKYLALDWILVVLISGKLALDWNTISCTELWVAYIASH